MSPQSEHGLPPGLTLARALATQEAGRAAAILGQKPSTCPHVSREGDVGTALRGLWSRGWAAGRTELRAARVTPDEDTAPSTAV